MNTPVRRIIAAADVKRVAIVDDDDDAAKSLELALTDGNYQTHRVASGSESVDALVTEIENVADAVVCDQRLRYGGFHDITGAELSSRLIERNIPVILVTQYLDQEADVSIRKFRRNLPVVLRREDADEPDELRAAFERCVAEMRNGRSHERKPHRTLLRVADVQDIGNESVVDAVIHGWNPQDAVRFPLSLVPEHIRPSIKRGTVLAAMSNIQTADKTALYFECFEIVPEPDPKDGLA